MKAPLCAPQGADVALLRIDQVSALVQYGRSSIWAMVKRGDFPSPVRLSRRCTRWDSRAVNQWIQQQFAGGGDE